MTVLDVCQRVSTATGLKRPTTVFGSTTDEAYILQDLVRECAEMIIAAHPWQVLSVEGTFFGDGTTEGFDLPSDYGWLRPGSEVRIPRLTYPLYAVLNQDKWLQAKTNNINYIYNAYIIRGRQMQFHPALLATDTVRYYYQSNNYALDTDGVVKTAFTNDADSFRLSERLLRLCMQWRLAEQKGLSYAEDLANYEEAKAELMTRDEVPWENRAGGSVFGNLPPAYPWTIDA